MRLKIIICLLIFVLGVAYSQNDCDKYSDDYIPKNLIDAISYLDCTWSEAQTRKNLRIRVRRMLLQNFILEQDKQLEIIGDYGKEVKIG